MKKIIQLMPMALITITFIYSLTHLSIINQITHTTFLSLQQLFFSLYFLMFLFSIGNELGLFFKFGKVLKPIFFLLFHLDEVASSIYFASFFAGYPTFAKIIRDAYISKQISLSKANHLLKICSHGSIGFTVLALGTTLFHDIKFGWLIFSFQIISNMLIALYLRNNLHQEDFIEPPQRKLGFVALIKKEMVQCLKVFIYIYGFMLVFNILSQMFLPNYPILHGFLEFSQGCLLLSKEPFSIQLILCNVFISFSSLSVIFQVSSLLDGLGLDIKGYIFSRLVQAILSTLLSFLYLIIHFA